MVESRETLPSCACEKEQGSQEDTTHDGHKGRLFFVFICLRGYLSCNLLRILVLSPTMHVLNLRRSENVFPWVLADVDLKRKAVDGFQRMMEHPSTEKILSPPFMG